MLSIKNLRIGLLIVLLAGMTSCSDEEVVVEDIPIKLTSSTYAFSRSAQELKVYVDAASLDIPTDELKYDVDFYRVEYATDYKGSTITASGIIMMPDTEEPISLMSYQHGTIAANRQAPSQLANSDYELILYQGIAAAGFVVIVPDYIGFGSSVEIMHPYYVEDLTSSAIIDNIYGAINLADELERNLTNRLYLAGYSQGGYATVATHKYIEEKGIKGLQLEASFASSGGYDVKGMQEYFFEQKVYHEPFYLAYVAQAYQVTLDVDSDLTSYFNEPYASAIPGFFDGTLSGSQINAQLNDTLSVLINPDYLSSPNDTRFASINEAFVQNSLVDWSPAVSLYLYHGDADITVPYQNSIDTYNQWIKNGASESVVTFTSLPGGTHRSGFFPYLEAFITELIELEKLQE